MIAADGRQADWVRNISKDPQVRVLAGRGWRHGTASLVPEDDTAQRSGALPYQWDSAVGRAIATTPLTVRIDLRQARSSHCEAVPVACPSGRSTLGTHGHS